MRKLWLFGCLSGLIALGLTVPVVTQNPALLFGSSSGTPVPVAVTAAGLVKVSATGANPTFSAGTGTATFHPSGSLLAPVTGDQTGTADTNYNCINLGTIPANTITKNGDQIIVEVEFTNATGSSSRSYNMNVGGTCAANGTGFSGGYTFLNTGGSTASANELIIGRFIRTSLNNAKGFMLIIGGQTKADGATTGSIAETGDMSLGFDFKDGSSAQNVFHSAVVTFRPAP